MRLNSRNYYLGPLIVMAIIFFLSHQPRVMDGLPHITGLDKLLHCMAYFTLAISWILALSKNKISYLKSKTFVFSMLFALSDEFHQTFVPTRSFEVLDLVADLVGIFLALLLLYIIPRIRSSSI
tara:strand:+ start:449 stop:820 length:372 start_codon:yes stop_codon:yes gene_type:complete